IAQKMYPGINREDLTEEQRQTISALGTLASGLAGGLAGGSTADAVAGAQAGKNALENNNLAILRTGAAACAEITVCSKAVIDLGFGALIGVGVATSAIEDLSGPQKTNVMLAAMSGDQEQIDKLSPSERAAYEELKNGKGLITGFPTPVDDPTDGKLVNPAPDQNKGTVLVTPDKSGENGASNTGSTDGKPDTGGNVLVNPGADQLTRDEQAYLAEGGPKVPPTLQPLTNPAQGPVIPEGWISKPGRTPGSIIYYPPNTDPSSQGSSFIRVMPSGSTPVPGLENGYWISVKNGQPINPATGGTGTRGDTHVPLPPDTMPPQQGGK
ncbi:VENN motif pre-toxin domain-containing protein, partial [Yersinia enterocolitica]